MPTVVACPRHPETETALRCNRCETPICPRCLVHSPVGAKCRDCAKSVPSPVYVLKTSQLARAIGAALVGAVIMGNIWGAVLLPFSFGFFSIFLGVGLGWAFTRLLDYATGHKRGPVVIGIAIAGIALAWGIQLLYVPVRVGLYGLVAVGVGIYWAYQNLR
ncbi:MAG: B-box zinc finger protein [Dehalococcoidia bacterium]